MRSEDDILPFPGGVWFRSTHVTAPFLWSSLYQLVPTRDWDDKERDSYDSSRQSMQYRWLKLLGCSDISRFLHPSGYTSLYYSGRARGWAADRSSRSLNPYETCLDTQIAQSLHIWCPTHLCSPWRDPSRPRCHHWDGSTCTTFTSTSTTIGTHHHPTGLDSGVPCSSLDLHRSRSIGYTWLTLMYTALQLCS